MNEVSLNHAALVMWPFHQDVAEHYGYYDELFGMDLRNPVLAREAISRWLMPEIVGWSKIGFALRKEACRLCIAQGAAFSPDWLPGIDDGWKECGDFQRYFLDLRNFQEIVWEMLFREVYSPKPLDGYVHRIDKQFESFPDSPSLWETVEYLPWPEKFK